MQTTRRNLFLAGAASAATAGVPVANATARSPLDPEALEIARLFMGLPDNQRAALHNLIRGLHGLDDDDALWLRSTGMTHGEYMAQLRA